jgi:hypothetical protein
MSAIFDEREAARGEVQLTLDAMLIYEDLSTGLRAKRVLEHAARQVPMAPNFNLAIWRFDVVAGGQLARKGSERSVRMRK